MEKLPLEIHLKILSSLTFNNRLLCLTVSKQWYSLFVGFLYKDLRFLKNHEANLQHAIKYFEIHQDIAKFVTSIKVIACPNSYLYLPKLPLLFPNVKKFIFEGTGATDTVSDSLTAIPGWEYLNTLRIKESVKEDQVLAIDGLLQHNYSHLTRMTVRFDDGQPMTNLWDSSFKEKKKRLLGNLKNLKCLESLILDRMHLVMEDMEELHQNLPNLKKLTLETVIFRMEETTKYDFRNLRPHRQEVLQDGICTHPLPVRLQSLEINVYSRPMDIDVLIVWLSYLAAKYRMLDSFVLNCINTSDYRDEGLERETLQLFHNSPQMKTYNMMICRLTRRITKRMEECNIHLDNINVYVKPYNLSKQLEALTDSTQVHSVKHATITFTDYSNPIFNDMRFFPEVVINDTPALLIAQHLANFRRLTHLEIRGKSNSVNLVSLYQYLAHLENLTHITLSNVYLWNRLNTSTPALALESSRIRHIDIDRLIISSMSSLNTMSTFFDQVLPHCPDLETFRIDLAIYVNYGYRETQSSRPYYLVLDFRSQNRLNSIQVSQGHGRYYHIIQERQNHDKYYYHDRSKGGKFIRITDFGEAEYLTRIYLNNPVFINQKQYH